MDVILHSKYVEQATDGGTILKYIPYINVKALKSSTWQPSQARRRQANDQSTE
jgi:hypothetical protein